MPKTASSGSNLPALKFKLYSKPEYVRDLIARIDRAVKSDRVSVVAMSFQPLDPLIKPLVDSLVRAAKRGVNVLLMSDAYNFLVSNGNFSTTPGPLLFRKELSTAATDKHPITQAMRQLRDAGGRAVVTNFPRELFTNPFAGRSHIKLALINDRVYIGGCNLDFSGEIDLMTAWDDQSTADWLQQICEKTFATENTGDVFHHQDIDRTLPDGSHILIDSGKPRQSIIYKQALRLIDEAREHILITCQFFPNHITAHHLSLAHERGVKVDIVYNHPGKDTFPFNFVHRAVVRFERTRRPRHFFSLELPKGTPFLHAKVIATESCGIIGSHNYVRAGVNWGTAEIALLRHDPDFAAQLRAKVDELIHPHRHKAV